MPRAAGRAIWMNATDRPIPALAPWRETGSVLVRGRWR